MGTRLLDDCLSIRDNHLFMEEVDCAALTERFGSPLFVMSEDQLRRNARRYQAAFAEHWPDGPVKVMPAAKANWLPAIQRILVEEGCGCDTYSEGELEVALQSGFEREYISVNGCPKTEEHIRRTVETGARLTLDSVEDVTLLERVLEADPDARAQVRIRIRATIDSFIEPSHFVAEGPVPTDIAALGYKSGLSLGEVMSYLPRIADHPRIEIMGFHQHHGRHHRIARYWEAQMRAYARDIAKVCEALGGYRPREIDIGGGFASPRDPFNAATDYRAPMLFRWLNRVSRILYAFGPATRYKWMARFIDAVVSEPNEIMAPKTEEYAAAAAGTLRAELKRHGIDPGGIMLQIEPGRSLFGNCGIHLATVQAIKQFNQPIRWKVVATDTTEFWFTAGRYEHHLHAFLVANNADAPMTGKADIAGRSCFGDRLLPTVRIPDIQHGDIIALLDTGAYQEVSASNFNAMPRPATILVHGGEAEVIRRAETLDEVFQRDTVPAHLALPPEEAAAK